MTAFFMAIFSFLTPANAQIDLSRASVERLDNGLTLIMLEDRTFPVVSIQTVYGAGAKDDPAGRLGLAHFFEHMAFRGSKNFPETGLVSEIYAAGGEWHGYTWIDLTTYFATAPKDDLPLLLDIEADRMARLDLKADEVEAERGAVLAEMNGYANDPDSTLFDALIAAHFLTHPYRNNTIGYARDVKAIRYDDIRDFYARRYAPRNAVIALVGDFDPAAARKAVERRFASITKDAAPRDPLTAEMPRTGERRIRLSLPSEEKLFKIAYPAPAASSADFPTFLVLQALIGESAGANFNQNDWGTSVGASSPLAGAGENLRSWIIATAEPYAFVISGVAAPKADEERIEKKIQKALDRLAREPATPETLAAAKAKVSAALGFDLDTTEEAAHQLAYFAGIGALDRLLTLEADVAAVTPDNIMEIAETYLGASKRTTAWLAPGPAATPELTPVALPMMPRTGSPSSSSPASLPTVIRTSDSSAVLFQQSGMSPTFAIKAVIGGRWTCDLCVTDEPSFGLTAVAVSGPIAATQDGFAAIASSIAQARAVEPTPPSSEDPMTRLEEVFSSFVGKTTAESAPHVVAISGNIEKTDAAQFAEKYFAGKSAAPAATFTTPASDMDILIAKPLAQAAVGYVAAAPPSSERAMLAMRLALYTLQHGYEGRLGKEAISRQGLAYYIDAQLRSGPAGGLVTLAAGVDPEKVDAFRDVLNAEIARMRSAPPSDAEIAEAKRHLLGRKVSAAQSNGEIADALISDFFSVGGPESPAEFASRLAAVGRDDVAAAASALAGGAVVTVRVSGVE
jgi:predicted Zn-dependent peptidase